MHGSNPRNPRVNPVQLQTEISKNQLFTNEAIYGEKKATEDMKFPSVINKVKIQLKDWWSIKGNVLQTYQLDLSSV